MSGIHENIKKRRIELGLSQEELANKTGYTSRSTIAKIEAGTNDIPQSKIETFAKALDTTPSYIMGWADAHTAPMPTDTEKGVPEGSPLDKLNALQREVYDTMLELNPDDAEIVKNLALSLLNRKNQ